MPERTTTCASLSRCPSCSPGSARRRLRQAHPDADGPRADPRRGLRLRCRSGRLPAQAFRDARVALPGPRPGGFDRPILMLTARAQAHDVVSGFDAGADDYLRKPFEMPELLSRVRALLKRVTTEDESHTHEASGVTVDMDKRSAELGGEAVDLTAKE